MQEQWWKSWSGLKSGRDSYGYVCLWSVCGDLCPGIITALRQFQEELRENKISIWVRRAGPNYQEGLRIIRDLGKEIRVPLHVRKSAVVC